MTEPRQPTMDELRERQLNRVAHGGQYHYACRACGHTWYADTQGPCPACRTEPEP